MGGGVYTRLAKGKLFAALDAAIAAGDQAALKQELMAAAKKLSEIGAKHSLLLTQDDKQHADDEWFGDFKSQNPDKAWWPYFGAKESIVRQGYILAYEKAERPGKPPLPVVTYWLNTGDRFEVLVTRSQYQVTVFLVTPMPPSMIYPQNEFDEDIWVVATTDRIKEIQDQHRFPDKVKTAATNEPGVRSLQARGY